MGTAEAKKASLQNKVLEVLRMSTIPSLLARVVAIAEDPKSDMSELEVAIEHDQAIATRVVAVSNSVFYGFPRKINSIHQAILVIGFDMVKGLAATSTAFKTFDGRSGPVLSCLWSHSFETAMASVMIAEKTGLVNKESAFLAGLLHDIGRPILLHLFSKEYLEVCAFDKNCLERETESFGATHAETGAWFAEKCKLPEDCVRAIRHHHDPDGCADGAGAPPPIVQIAYLANLVASDASDRYSLISPAHASILKSLGLTGDDLQGFSEELAVGRAAVLSYFA